MRKRCRKRLQAVAKKAAEKVFYFLSRPLIIEDSVLFYVPLFLSLCFKRISLRIFLIMCCV